MSCTNFPPPTLADQAEFVLRLYFGSGDDWLALAMDRAYRDLNRTIHGVGKYPEARTMAASALRDAISSLANISKVMNEPDFDAWHQQTCVQLCDAYKSSGFDQFTVGQAQKWINMTLKYVFVFGEPRLPGYEPIYPFCHVPIDNILLGTAEFNDLNTFDQAWSRITDYAKYLEFQNAVRKKFHPWAPLAVEFWAWQEA